MLTYWWLRSSLQLVQASMQASIPNILMVSIVDKEETPVRVGRVGAWGMTAPIQQGGEAGKPRGRRLLSSLHVSLSPPHHSLPTLRALLLEAPLDTAMREQGFLGAQ